MRGSMRVVLVSLVAAVGACSAGGAGGPPTPSSNTWVARPWADTAGHPTATAYYGLDIQRVDVTLQSLTVDTTADSIAQVMFHFILDCDRCVFHFRASRAVDNDGENWDMTDMPTAPYPGRDGSGWMVRPGSRRLYVVYSAPMAGRPQRPTALTLTVRVVHGRWTQDLTFDPLTLDWSKATVEKK